MSTPGLDRVPLVTGSQVGDWVLFALLLAALVVSSWRLQVYFDVPPEPEARAAAPTDTR